MKIYCIDCDKFKRDGAALAFNNLFAILKDQDNICDKYFIELFNVFCLNFKLSEEFGDLRNHLELDQVSKSLDHIVRVFCHKSYIFNEKSKDRIVPNGFGNGCLIDIIYFLFKECSNKLLEYRRKCMKMVEKLLSKKPEIATLRAFLKKFVTISDLLQLCETEIHENPNMTIQEDSLKISPYMWLQHLLSSIDCYCWILQNSEISNARLLFDKNRGYNIFEAATHFFKNICNEFTQTYVGENMEKVTVTSENGKIFNMKCLLIIRLIEFFEYVMKYNCEAQIPDFFWNTILHELQCFMNNLILETESLDFYCNYDFLPNLRLTVENFWVQFSKLYKNEKYFKSLVSYLTKRITEVLRQTSEKVKQLIISFKIDKKSKNKISGISFGIKCLKDYIVQSTEHSDIMKSLIFEIVDNLYEGIALKMDGKYINTISPEAKVYTCSLLDLCFLIGDVIGQKCCFYEKILDLIFDGNVLITLNSKNQSTHGLYFFKIFRNSLCAALDDK